MRKARFFRHQNKVYWSWCIVLRPDGFAQCREATYGRDGRLLTLGKVKERWYHRPQSFSPKRLADSTWTEFDPVPGPRIEWDGKPVFQARRSR